MKTTLTLTSRGVVTLPAKLRRALGLRADDQLIAETTPDGLLLRPAVTLPVEIYSERRIREFDEAEAELAVGFFGSRYERATPSERDYLRAMAGLTTELAPDAPVSTTLDPSSMPRAASAWVS
jgi:AbrB family looped-hinge helix DNA binding protein